MHCRGVARGVARGAARGAAQGQATEEQEPLNDAGRIAQGYRESLRSNTTKTYDNHLNKWKVGCMAYH